MLKPLFFGDTTAPLYGVLHPADPARETEPGVLICPPFADEAIISYSWFRQLANQLAMQGHATLRFDYTGSGDSAGEDEAFNLAQATKDTHLAIDELISLSGCERVLILGARLGAYMALQGAKHPSVSGAVLLDPVCDGATYLNQMITTGGGVRPLRDGGSAIPGTDAVGINGIAISPGLHAELSALEITGALFGEDKVYRLICRPDDPANRLQLPFADAHCADHRALWQRSPGADMPAHSTDSFELIRTWVARS